VYDGHTFHGCIMRPHRNKPNKINMLVVMCEPYVDAQIVHCFYGRAITRAREHPGTPFPSARGCRRARGCLGQIWDKPCGRAPKRRPSLTATARGGPHDQRLGRREAPQRPNHGMDAAALLAGSGVSPVRLLGRGNPRDLSRIAVLYFFMGTQLDRITIDPDICNGKPVVRGLRITVETILDYLSAGETQAEVLRQHPMLEPEDISACLAFASRLLRHKYSVKETAA